MKNYPACKELTQYMYLLVLSADKIAFANRLDPDQVRQNGSNLFETQMVFLKEFLERKFKAIPYKFKKCIFPVLVKSIII